MFIIYTELEQNVSDNDSHKLYGTQNIDTSPVNSIQVTKDILICLWSVMC